VGDLRAGLTRPVTGEFLMMGGLINYGSGGNWNNQEFTTAVGIISGTGLFGTTESHYKYAVPFDCVVRGLRLRLSTTGGGLVSGSCTFRIRVNNANTALLATWASTDAAGTIVSDDDEVQMTAGDTLSVSVDPTTLASHGIDVTWTFILEAV